MHIEALPFQNVKNNLSRRITAGKIVRLLLIMALVMMTLPITPSRAAATTFTVINTNDSGAGSFRQALIDADNNVGVDTIEFNIPEGDCSAAGVCSIALLSDLPVTTEAVIIDGTTQPRYGTAPANVCATASVPSYMRVQITAAAGTFMLLLSQTAGASTIRGLSLGGGKAIELRSNAAHHVACNHLGVNAEGTAGLGSIGWGIMLQYSADGAIIGTNGDGVDDIGERNVFGDYGWGVYINANPNMVIAGNYFGFGADGVTDIGLSIAIYVRQSSTNNLVGSNLDGVSDLIERNIIGNNYQGVYINSDGDNNQVVGNWIGVDAKGDPAANTYGIDISDEGQNHLIQKNRIEANITGIRVNLATTSPTLAAGSTGNCLINNTTGFYHTGDAALVFENNWWNAADGPSGDGSGSGDSVTNAGSGSVDYDPWLTSEGEGCWLIANGSFEDALGGEWSENVSANSDGRIPLNQAQDGSYIYYFAANGGLEVIQQNVAQGGTTGDEYTLSFYFGGKDVSANGYTGARLILKNGPTMVDKKTCIYSRPGAAFPWALFTCTVTATGDFDSIQILIGIQNVPSGKVGVDNVSLAETTPPIITLEPPAALAPSGWPTKEE